ncbi:MAG: hypothetical protein GTN89_10195 [Acidobacteria bacterium]|nr:hypothetical protein [Acidobacteriota bacterium]NIM61415.1 hypothetical protein [Acidobacteriota bacterium]NIO59626.1 hypothetical protein [Acidobacteriota bacterium]NIQ30723.1 hypothetical protein [Acidobacteriota bacterium]NIQ85719.1 hypothetical protein [Acidobacteriota bacterium]
MLINLQPYAQPIRIEVHQAAAAHEAGVVFENEEKREDMRSSLREVKQAVADGLFALKREIHWQLEMRYRTRDEWDEFLERPSHGGIEADEEAIHAALARPRDSVLTIEDDSARLYERL